MNALLQAPGHLKQPLVHPPPRPPLAGIWAEKQPAGSKKPSRSSGVFDQQILWAAMWPERQSAHLQTFNREIPLDSPTRDLEAFYVIDGRPAVACFIKENRLRGILLEAREPLTAAFGKDAIKTLALVRDDEGFDTLFCLIMVTGDMQGAREALRSFDQHWWLGRSGQIAEKLNFDFDLV